MLGGPDAVGEAVVGDPANLGIGVQHIFGPDRNTTVVEIAMHVAPRDTVILARAYSSPDSPTTDFADALSALAMAAEARWPSC